MKKRNGYIIESIGSDTYRIDEYGVVNCYLLTGKDAALLIDTGCGLGGLPDAIREITKLPLIAALSHAHPDHAGGISAFPGVYANPLDKRPSLRLLNTKLARKVFLDSLPSGTRMELPDKIRLCSGSFARFINMPNEHTFHLGGRGVRVIHVPGHTRGSAAFVDEEGGFLFTGDDINPNLLLQLPNAASVRQWLQGAVRLRALAREGFRCFYGHDSGVQTTGQMDATIALGEEILSSHTKNSFEGKTVVYPSQEADVRIVFRTDRVL